MHYAYTILYVPDVEKALSFYEQAFGFDRAFMVESGEYGELSTGQTKLAFAKRDFATGLTSLDFAPVSQEDLVPPVEFGFVTENVEKFYQQALAAGAVNVKAPHQKPWGQTVAYVRDPNGYLLEICTAMGG